MAPSIQPPGCGTNTASALLLDPYGVAVAVPAGYDRMAGARPGRDPRTAMKSVVADLSAYDWEGDVPLGRPFTGNVIYELHVRGLTAIPPAGWSAPWPAPMPGWWPRDPLPALAGDYRGGAALPVQAFDPQDTPSGLANYWGYSPVSLFAPHPATPRR